MRKKREPLVDELALLMIVTRSSYHKIQLSEHRRKQTNPKLTNCMVMMRGSISMDFVEETARHSKILGMFKCHRGWRGARTWLGCQLNLKVAFVYRMALTCVFFRQCRIGGTT